MKSNTKDEVNTKKSQEKENNNKAEGGLLWNREPKAGGKVDDTKGKAQQIDSEVENALDD